MKLALVTGSAIGIGASIIKELAKEGYNCVINYHTSKEQALFLKQEVEEKYNIKCLALQADISNEEEVNRMFLEIEKEFGGEVYPFSAIDNRYNGKILEKFMSYNCLDMQ